MLAISADLLELPGIAEWLQQYESPTTSETSGQAQGFSVTTALVADRVEVRDDLLHVEGGAFAIIDVPEIPARIQLGVALVLVGEQGLPIVGTSLELAVAGPDSVVRPQLHAWFVPWPAPAEPALGQPIVVPATAPIGIDVLQEGRHTIIVFPEGRGRHLAAIPFAVRLVAEPSSA